MVRKLNGFLFLSCVRTKFLRNHNGRSVSMVEGIPIKEDLYHQRITLALHFWTLFQELSKDNPIIVPVDVGMVRWI